MMLARVSRGSALARSAGCRRCFSLGRALVNRPIRWTQSSVSATPPSRTLGTSSRFQSSAAAAAAAPVQDQEAGDPSAEARLTQFSQLSERGLVNKRVVDAITDGMRISDMTDVQSLTIGQALKGTDTLAQAKTGTGKTLAFLVPVVQKILEDTLDQSKAGTKRLRPTTNDIRGIIVSPTRELAEQIYSEALKVVRNTHIAVGTAVGGSRKNMALQEMRRKGCHLLIGTPGRLIDVLSDPYSGVEAPQLKSFVLDEADRLLDIGFAPDIARMQEYLPSRSSVDRQSLLFSATVPRGVMDVVSKTMKPDFNFVQTVKEDEVPTHLSVPQKVVFLRGLENQLPAIVELAKQAVDRHRADPSKNGPFKAIVYFNSTAEVSLATSIFSSLLRNNNEGFARSLRGMPIIEMHSKLSQAERNRQSMAFRKADSGILFSSDVTARGMDFPNVTHVIQVGSPRDKETYIHRLGRTARANKSGEGWLFVSNLDYQSNPHKFRDLPIKPDRTSLPCAAVDMTAEGERSPEIAATLNDLSVASRRAPMELKETAYRACFFFSEMMSNKRKGFEMVRDLAVYGWGMESPPAMATRRASSPRNRSSTPDFASSREPRRPSFGGSRGKPNSYGGPPDRSSHREFARSREPRRPDSGGFRGKPDRRSPGRTDGRRQPHF